ncbi:MAG: hypothetical protein WCF67_05125 [Chitinophagaceae bacterium]
MAAPKKYLAQLLPEKFYHIYNRTNNKEPLFYSDENKRFFLKQYAKYISPYARTYGYNLLGNHFHLVISVRSESEITDHVKGLPRSFITAKELDLLKRSTDTLYFGHFIEWQFLRLFTSYSMALNNSLDRKGNLFHKPFKRVEISSDKQFLQTLLYVHCNAVKHGLVKNVQDYSWSSYPSYLTDKPTLLEKKYALDLMGGIEKFIKSHEERLRLFHSQSFTAEKGEAFFRERNY